jgi:hypothetical protein
MTEDETKRENEELLKESESFLELLDQKATMEPATRVVLKNVLASIIDIHLNWFTTSAVVCQDCWAFV